MLSHDDRASCLQPPSATCPGPAFIPLWSVEPIVPVVVPLGAQGMPSVTGTSPIPIQTAGR